MLSMIDEDEVAAGPVVVYRNLLILFVAEVVNQKHLRLANNQNLIKWIQEYVDDTGFGFKFANLLECGRVPHIDYLSKIGSTDQNILSVTNELEAGHFFGIIFLGLVECLKGLLLDVKVLDFAVGLSQEDLLVGFVHLKCRIQLVVLRDINFL